MSISKRPYTTAELVALPVGTIFTVTDSTTTGVWRKFSVDKAELLSHHGSETEDMEWFASDSESRTRNGTRMPDPESSWPIEVVGFDQNLVPHGRGDKLRIYINRKLDITPNKRAAHAVHAALVAFGVHPGVKVIVLDAGPTKIEDMRVSIHDAGHTELAPGTLTAGTDWPDDTEE